MEIVRKLVSEPFRRWTISLSAIFVALLWVFFWYFPWQTMFRVGTWLSMGMSLAIFILPGLSIYGLLADRSFRLLNHITFGFVLSHLIIAFLGTLGRLVHVPFAVVKFLMMALGLVSLLACLLRGLQSGWTFRIRTLKLSEILSITLLLVIFLLTSLIVLQRMLSDDDVTYLAYITNWQHSTHLDFNELIFGEGYLLQPRFWLMSVPFAQALLSDLGKIPGILTLAGYYEPFLVLIVMLSWYELARTLRFSNQAASVVVVLQMVFLLLLSEYLHPGAPFFNQLSSDKAIAAYILAPVFVQSGIWVIGQPTKKNIVLFFLTGFSMTFMHPIALAYIVFIVGFLLLLNTDRTNFRSRLILFAILVAILLPQIIFRFVGARAGEGIPYNTGDIANAAGMENLITRLGDTPFYGFNPAILGMKFPYESKIPIPGWILTWGWLVIPASGIFFAIRRLGNSHAAQYIFSAFLLGLLVGIPFTGWIVGYFVSAWMLERALWFFPFGLSAVFLLVSLRDETGFGKRFGQWLQGPETAARRAVLPLLLISIFSATIILLFMRENGLPDLETFGTKIRRYEDIAEVGRFLDRQIQFRAVVIGSEALNDFMPGVSWKAKLITFRISDPSNMLYFSPEEIAQRIADRQVIFSETASPEVKLDLLSKYDIQFIILTGADRALFADLLARYPSVMTMEKVERFFVIKIKDE